MRRGSRRDQRQPAANRSLQDDARHLSAARSVRERRWFEQALAHHRAQRLPQARRCYDRVLDSDPHHVQALHYSAVVLHQLGDGVAAVARIGKALALTHADAADAEIHGNAGTLLRSIGAWHEARAHYERAIALRPQWASAHYNLGALLAEHTDTTAAAVRALQTALRLDPSMLRAHEALAVAWASQREYVAAAHACEQVLASQPGHLNALDLLAESLRHTCQLDAAPAAEARLLSLLPSHDPCACVGLPAGAAPPSPLPLLSGHVRPFELLSMPSTARQQLANARRYSHARFGRTPRLPHQPTHMPTHPAATCATSPRVTLGYLSADLHQHATCDLLARTLECHDRSRFRINAYSYGPDDGSLMRRRIAAAVDTWIDIAAVADASAAQRIFDDRVDILIDLKGYTRDARPRIAAYRPAPLCVSFLGYPGTMGAKFVDYLVADRVVIPTAQRPNFSEALIVMPHSYQSNDDLRAIAPSCGTRRDLGLPEAGIVLCCFNSAYKITRPIFDIWMRVLARTPGSVLWLLEASAAATTHLRAAAAASGIDPLRLVFAPRRPGPEYRDQYRYADLFVDTLPVNAHTTASDALWAGCPVVTCAGETFVARVAASLLVAAGLPDLVTHDLGSYETLVMRLAHDPAARASLRARVAAARVSPLFDSPGYTRGLEAGLAAIWQRHRAGLPPADIDVGAVLDTPERHGGDE